MKGKSEELIVKFEIGKLNSEHQYIKNRKSYETDEMRQAKCKAELECDLLARKGKVAIVQLRNC